MFITTDDFIPGSKTSMIVCVLVDPVLSKNDPRIHAERHEEKDKFKNDPFFRVIWCGLVDRFPSNYLRPLSHRLSYVVGFTSF